MGYVHERGYVCGLNLEHGEGLVHRREACFLMKTTLLCEHDLSRARAPTEPPCSPHLIYLVRLALLQWLGLASHCRTVARVAAIPQSVRPEKLVS